MLLALGGGAAFVVARLDAVLRYRWNWASLGPALLHRSAERGDWESGLLLQGFATTLRLSVWSSLLALLLGLAFGLCRVSGSVYLRLLGGAYVGFVRNMPLLVFLFLFYFFLSSQLLPALGLEDLGTHAGAAAQFWPGLLFGPPRQLGAFVTGAVCLALYEGAYMAEIVRAGLQAVPLGQWEAARSLGLGRWIALWRVVLPQALRTSLPALAGQVILLVKASSVASLISIPELTYMANEVSSSNNHVFETWTAAAALYFAVCFGCATLFAEWERRRRQG